MIRVFSVVAGLLLFLPAAALAIRIDSFEGAQLVQSTGVGQVSSTVAQPNALGGFRTIRSEALSSASGVKDEVRFNGSVAVFEHSQDFGVKARSALVWDADAESANLNAAGLGGLNLLQDQASGILLSGLSFDYPDSSKLALTLYIFDASDAAGQKWSSAQVVFDRVVRREDVLVPFTSFTTAGPNGPASMNTVGALMLVIDGEPAADMQLLKIGTNGKCDLIPVQGKVIDECGVCGGDNKSCADCQGKPNGAALPGTSCDSSGNGECRPGLYDASCGCKSKVSPAAERCDGLDNDCDGMVDEIVDACGVCGGDYSSCLNCESKDLKPISTKLDGGAKSQERVIRTYLHESKFALPSKIVREYLRDAKLRANRLQIRNWILSWTLPGISITCAEAAICVRQSNTSILDEYRTHAYELLQLFYEVQQSSHKVSGPGPNKERRLAARAEALYKANIELANTVPEFQSSCTPSPVG